MRAALATVPASSALQIVKRAASAPKPQKFSFTVAETAAATGLSVCTVRRLIAAGRLPASRVGSRVLVLTEGIESLLRRGQREMENQI